MIVGTADGKILVWDTATLGLKQTLDAHDELVNKLAFSPDGETLASASFDGTVKLWRSDAGS